MNVSIDVVFGDSLNDPLGSLDMHILQREVPGTCLAPASCWPIRREMIILRRVVSADEVEDDVRVSDAGLDRRGVVKVVFLGIVVAGSSSNVRKHTTKTIRPRSPVTLR